MVYIGGNKKKLLLTIRFRQGEELLVDLSSLVDISVQVNLRCLDGRMPKILLDHPEVLGAFVELACITVADLMGSYPRRGIMFEDVLNSPRRNVFSLLADKKGANDPVANEPEDISKGVIINEHNAYLVTFSLNPDSMLVEIYVLDVHVAEL